MTRRRPQRRINAHGLTLDVDEPFRLADIACGAGLAGDGYAMAGIPPTIGVDLVEQPDYPYPFLRASALDLDEHGQPDGGWLLDTDTSSVDALHLSLPCQAHTRALTLRIAQGGVSRWPDLLTPAMPILRSRWAHVPWIVENVDAPGVVRILAPRPGEHLVRLCGSTFGLKVQRHRWFLANFPLRQPACAHHRFDLDPITRKPRPWGVYHVPGDSVPSGGRTARNVEHAREVMGVARPLPWDTLKEGFPPHYTAHVGADLVAHLRGRR